MKQRPSVRALVGALAIVATALVAAGPAQAGTAIPSLPSTNAWDGSPRVVDDGVIADAGVRELRQVGSTMYAGGEFDTVRDAAGTTSYTRTNIFSFDANTGAVSTWAPRVTGASDSVPGGDVYALEASADGRYLYIGGDFTSFQGVSARKLVKYDLQTNTVVTSFRFPVTSAARVSDLQLVGGRLFVSGTFPGGIVAVNPDTGARDPYFDGTQAAGQKDRWSTRIYRFSVNPAGTRMVVLGSFLSIGGQPRQQAAVLTLGATSAGVSAWTSSRWTANCAGSLQWYTRDVDWSLDGSHFAIGTTGGPYSGTLCDAVSWWNAVDAGNQQPVWVNYSGGDTFHSVVVTDKGVIVGGHFRWLDNPQGHDSAGPGAVSRQGLGAIDATTGKALAWNPTKSIEGGMGAFDLYFTSRGLWVGHFEQNLTKERHEGLGLLPF
jgi:hypothetical protein